jgi:hypothetical protein
MSLKTSVVRQSRYSRKEMNGAFLTVMMQCAAQRLPDKIVC